MPSIIEGSDNFNSDLSGLKTLNGQSLVGVGGNITLKGATDVGKFFAAGTPYGLLAYNISGNHGPDHTTSTNRLWIMDGWRGNGSTSDGSQGNGDIYFVGSGGRVITCLGGDTSNSFNQFTWNKRSFLATSGTNHYRSSNSITRPTAPGLIYMAAGCRMATDRSYYFYNARFLEVPSSDTSLETFAQAFFDGAA